MFNIYILKSLKFGKYYIGSCEDITTRLKQHNTGKTKSTKRFMPWELVYKESFNTRSEAVKREQQLKSWKSRKALEKLIKEYF
ncbi:MAG: GIY-YIG nuclease family protein [Patescibacteria group bacterium]|nr:GIY-YIG nuclease family protein [Patescibacteria group bacterium]